MTTQQVTEVLRRINSSKAAGLDNIPGRVLKEYAQELTSVLTDIFNLSLSQAVVPVCWKTSTIMPVPKNSAAKSKNDYRPVALTPIVMKNFERLVMAHIKDTIDSNADPHQYAYRTVEWHTPSTLIVAGAEVEMVSSLKYLGSQISNDLTWNNYTTTILKKAHQHLYFLGRLQQVGLSPAVLTYFYRCVVESTLTSSISVWYGKCSAADKAALQ